MSFIKVSQVKPKSLGFDLSNTVQVNVSYAFTENWIIIQQLELKRAHLGMLQSVRGKEVL